jgi:hypothetical protein
MNVESNLSGHWTDEQLIEQIYGIAPKDLHLEGCQECQGRLAAMLSARREVERNGSPEDQLAFDLLAAQRRRVYERIGGSMNWQFAGAIRRWAAAAAMVAVLGGGALVYEQQRRQTSQNTISDIQLAQQVSQIANDSEPGATAPLQALFDE